jgi:hypothetical protein
VDWPADRASRAVLGREWLLHGHLQDRLGMALVMERASREEMQDVAIDEWMAASPVYSKRMQRALNFSGDGVDTIMKNLQLDIGAPHEFMDFKYRLIDREHGEFWLEHCGALMDVEPMGVEFVHGMCHTIEDPTFDATAGATNPHAQIRPLHRPPRVPADRAPHCHWTIAIVPDEQRVAVSTNQALVHDSEIARLDVLAAAASDDGGLADYAGAFDPDFCLEDLSGGTQLVALHEFAIQSHLLLRSLLLTVTQRWGHDFAFQLAPRLMSGWGALTAQRLKAAFGLSEDTAGLATMLRLHPILHPASYVDARIDLEGEVVRLAFGAEAIAAREGDDLTWFSQLGGAMDGALDHIVQAFHPQARLSAAMPADGELHAYAITIDPDAAPAGEFGELAVAKISTGSGFQFARPGTTLLPVIGDKV